MTENHRPEGYTIREAAQLLGLTKNTAKYRLQKAPEGSTRRSEDGRIFLTETGLEWLRTTTDNQEEPEQPQDENQATGSESKETDLQAVLKLLENQLQTKDAQLHEKDLQIARLQEQAENLTAALQTAQEQASTAQALHAGTIQQGLLESAATEPAPQETPHRPWWRFWE